MSAHETQIPPFPAARVIGQGQGVMALVEKWSGMNDTNPWALLSVDEGSLVSERTSVPSDSSPATCWQDLSSILRLLWGSH